MTDTNPNPSFSYDVIIDILFGLSVKPLLKFRTLWGKRCYKSCSLYSLANQPSSEAIQLNYQREMHDRIVGCCNGLVCLVIRGQGHRWCLWNPSTRKLRYVYSHNDGRQFMCEFGYDEHNDDYKLVKMFLNYSDTACKTQVEIYSSKFDCWRQIEDFPFAEPLSPTFAEPLRSWTSYDAGKFTNGNLHWEATLDFNSDDEPDSWIIAFLELEKETYGQVLQPNYGEGNYYLTLGILSGYLSVLCSYVESRADVWIMKEYGRKESWTKLVTIPLDDALDSWEVLVPLHISMNGDILLKFDGHRKVYDSKKKKPRRIRFSECCQLGIYTESLVSPIAQSSA